MKKITRALALLAFVSAPFAAQSATVNQNTWYTFGFFGVGTPLISGDGFDQGTNPGSLAAPDGPWEFTLVNSATLIVLDLFLSFDEFAISNFGSLLGNTSASTVGGSCSSDITCALGDSSYSRGLFNLGPGSYSITGTQIAGQGGAGAFIIQPSAVPIPAAGGLLLGALGLLGVGRLRKSRKA